MNCEKLLDYTRNFLYYFRMLDINNYIFTYKQLSAPDARRQINDWECIILNKENNINFGIKFNCQGDPSLHNQELFNVFCEKQGFNEKFFIDCEEIKEQVIEIIKPEILPDIKEIEKPVDETPKIDQTLVYES